MRFVCESCRAQYMINDDKVGPKGVKVRCRKCGYVITVKRTEAAPKAVAPESEPDSDAMETQVMRTPLADGGGASEGSDAKGGQPENFLGADDDEIGAVFDQVLRSGPTASPKAGGDSGSPAGDFDEHESTRVIDAATVAQLAKESGTKDPVPEKVEAAPENNWFVAINEKQTGPLTLDKVKEHWDKGEVGPDSLCWREGFQDWVPLSEVKSLAVVLAPKPPKPIVVPAATLPAAPTAASAPVQSAFSAGGVAPQSDAPATAAAPPSVPEDSGAWKPTAASALASLVKDEMDALAKPPQPTPPPAEPSGASRLIDVPEERGTPSPSPLMAAAPVPRANPYSDNAAATYSAPGMTAYQPPSNRGLVIGLSAVVGLVLVGLIGTVAWLVFGGRAPVQPAVVAQATQVPPAPAPSAAIPSAAPGASSPTPTATKPPEAPGPSVPPAAAPAAAGPTQQQQQQPPPTATSTPPVAARIPLEPKGDSQPVRERTSSRKETKSKSDSAPEAKEPKEVKEEPRPQTASGSDDFDSVFKVPGGKREEPKKAETPAKREAYVPPAPGQGSDVKDTLGQSDILEVVLSNKPALLKCAEEQRQKEPGTSGKLVMRWSIQANGKVSNVSVVSEEFKNTYVAGCVAKAIKSWTFPRTKNPPDPFTLPVKF